MLHIVFTVYNNSLVIHHNIQIIHYYLRE